MAIASDKKVADITLGELKELIREVILETLDPDYGLELRSEVVQALQESLQEKERGEGIALEEASVTIVRSRKELEDTKEIPLAENA
jgi:ABC-type glutathione transport system ATPase component